MNDLTWLKDAYYIYDKRVRIPYLDLHLPNSGNDVKIQRFRGRKQCETIMCLLDALHMNYEIRV